MPASQSSSWHYCQQLLQQVDHEHYLIGFFLPTNQCKLVLALRAFNAETAVRKGSNGETQLMRIAFWRECVLELDKCESTIQHPVFRALKEVNEATKLDKYLLNRLLNSREKDVKANAYYNIQELEDYAEGTSSTLLYLTLQALAKSTLETDHVATHIGKAHGLCLIVKSMLRDVKCIPQDLAHQHSFTQSDQEIDEETVKAICFEICNSARLHLLEAQRLYRTSSIDCIRLHILPSVIFIQSTLNTLSKHDYNVKKISKWTDGWTPLRMLYYAKLSNKIL